MIARPVTGRTVALVWAAACAILACQHTPEPAAAPSPPPMPEGVWAYAGNSPAWIHVDLAELRADPRAQALWSRAGATADGDPLGGALESADELVIAWRDPAFSQRLNVVSGAVGGERIRQDMLAPSFTPYTAGHTNVWTNPSHAWAVAVPNERTLITGDIEAVRAAVVGPCHACGSLTESTLSGHMTVLDAHRVLARAALDSRPLAEALAGIDTIDGQVKLSLGIDAVIRIQLVDGEDAAGIALLVREAIDALRETLADAPSASFASALLGRVRLDVGSDTIELYWELERGEVDALAAALAASLAPE